MVDGAGNVPKPFTFNKKTSVDFTKFQGASKDSLITQAGENQQRKNLIESIFNKYDTNGDGILTQKEFDGLSGALRTAAKGDGGDLNAGGDLKRFNKDHLGIQDKGSYYSLEDLEAVVGLLTDGTNDGVSVAEDGSITVTKQEENKTTTTEYYPLPDGAPATQKPNQKSVSVTENNSTITTKYAEDGNTITGKTREHQIGGHRYTDTLDPANGDRVLTRTENVQGDTLTTKYTYNEGNTTDKPDIAETTNSLGKVTKRVVTENGVTTETEYAADGETPTKVSVTEDGVTTTTTYENGKPKIVTVSENGTVKTTSVNNYNANGTLESVAEYDGDQTETPKSTTINAPEGKDWASAKFDGDGTTKVSTRGKVWYQIAQEQFPAAKDGKTIMAIVHAMKDKLGIDYKSSSMPSEISIPTSVTVGDKVYTIGAATATDVANQDVSVARTKNETIISEEVVENPEVPDNASLASAPVEPIVQDGYITNMADVLMSLEGVASVAQGESGIEVKLHNGKTLEVGNTPDELTRIKSELSIEAEPNPISRNESPSVVLPDPATDLEGYLAQDTVYQGFVSVQNNINARIAEIEQRYGIESGDNFGFTKITNRDDSSDYMRYDLLRTTIAKDLDEYKTRMQNWQDGTKWADAYWSGTGRGVHTYTNVECITLSNGQKAYKTDQGTFYPRENGLIGDRKVPDELLPKDE